ncbi:MAG TPA: hypothetical protein VNW30_01745 [Opitutaceae bacterium]|jgi:hypothetical protein|nr:hypothetical protein [Opitutaceae bacterium]
MLICRPRKKPDVYEFRQSILNLVLSCPVEGGNPPDCQLCEYRNLDLRTRFEWVQGLTLDEAQGIWATHEKCLMLKKCQKSR